MSTNNERPTPRTDAVEQRLLREQYTGGKEPNMPEILDALMKHARELERELIVSVNAVVETTDKLIKLTAERDAYKASYEDLAATFH